ncbi:MAG: hypothetical protein R8M45_04865, partial [Ghiorsea sp.]
MYIQKMIKAALVCTMFALASCGATDTATTTTTPAANSSAPAANTVVVANTGSMTVTVNDAYGFPYKGAIVSIGNTGANSLTTDATGKAMFNGLTAGAVDVHVFDTVN